MTGHGGKNHDDDMSLEGDSAMNVNSGPTSDLFSEIHLVRKYS